MANFTKLATIGGLAAILAGPALAQTAQGWDTNTDGMLDTTEFQSGFSNQTGFSNWDSDADGMLTDQEFGSSLYGQYDRDASGMIEASEFESAQTDFGTGGFWSNDDVTNVETVDSAGAADAGADAMAGFETWDANADGMLDQSEFQTGLGSQGAYAGFDADADGNITQDEYAQGVFNRYDADRSGTLDATESAGLDADFGTGGRFSSDS